MFFRFYILAILGCLLVLPTSVWLGGALILAWLISIPVKGIPRYKNWKEQRSIFYPQSLSFCLKSMKRQKQNFRIINKITRIKNLRIYFKKLSILLDDINVKFTSDFDSQIDTFDAKNTINNEYYDCPSYSKYSFNAHYDFNKDR